MLKLNGWRRLGIALALLWVVACVAIAWVEVSGSKPILFAYFAPPEGTVVDSANGTITLPNGTVFDMWVTVGTGFAAPWEIKWSDYPNIPVRTYIDPWRFGIISLVPAAL